VLEPLRSLRPLVDVFSPMPYPALQQMLDGSAPPGLRNYFRGGYAPELSNDLIDVVLAHGARMPSPMSAIHLHHMGGAVDRAGPADTAFSGRTAAYTYNLISTWTSPAEDGQHIGANRALAAQLAPLSQDGSYVNFLTDTAGDSNASVHGQADLAEFQKMHSAAAAACRARFRRWSRVLDPARRWWRCAGLAAAFVRPSSRSQRRVGAGKKGQDLADRAFPASGLREREVRLDLVAVAAAVLLLDHVAGLGQLGDDAVGAALGDARPGRDVA